MSKKPYSDDRWIGTFEELDLDRKPMPKTPEQGRKGKILIDKLRKLVDKNYNSDGSVKQ